MFKETLHISVSVSTGDLTKMETSLSTRFGRVAKKFGKGLLGAVAGGGFLGAATAILDKLFNPLKEVQEALDRTLHGADSLKDRAEQFGTSSGELAKLHAFGKAKGLDATEVDTLVQKFQTAVAEATADPHKETSVRNFVGNKDTGQAFLTFLENLSKLSKSNPNEAIRVQQEVFGERQIGKSNSFINADFGELSKKFAKFDVNKLTADIDSLAKKEDIVQTAGAIRELSDFSGKAGVITDKIVQTLEQQKDIAQEREDAKIARTTELAVLKTTADSVMALLETKLLPLIGQGITQLAPAMEYLRRISTSPLLKRFGLGGKED